MEKAILEAFATGAIAVASVAATLFFLRFWRDARDSFFLAFAVYFAVEAFCRTALLFVKHPNEGAPWIYIIRLLALILILAAILKKNVGTG